MPQILSCQSYFKKWNAVLKRQAQNTNVTFAMFLFACKLETFLDYWEEIENWCTIV